jgi:hypothetical protein
MNALLPLVLVSALVIALPAHAAPKKKGGGPPPAPAAAPARKAPSPATALQPYIDHLDGLLALNPPPPKSPAAPLYRQAEGKLTVLRQQFVTEGQAAPEEQKDKYRGAVATADSITAAIAERRQTAANVEASRQMTGTSKLEQGPRKDNLSQGVHGALPKAVAEIEEGRRERIANRTAKGTAANTDKSMTAMAVNRWQQRCIQLRQGIMANYAKAQ